MKGSWLNFFCGLFVMIGIFVGIAIVDNYAINFLMVLICGLLFAIFLQLADLKNKE